MKSIYTIFVVLFGCQNETSEIRGWERCLAVTPGLFEFYRFTEIELFTRDHCILWDNVDFFVYSIEPARHFEFYEFYWFVKIELFTRDHCTLRTPCFFLPRLINHQAWPRAGQAWPRAGQAWPRASQAWPRAGQA